MAKKIEILMTEQQATDLYLAKLRDRNRRLQQGKLQNGSCVVTSHAAVHTLSEEEITHVDQRYVDQVVEGRLDDRLATAGIATAAAK